MNVACDKLKKEYDMIRRSLDKVIRGPLAMIAAIEDMINRATDLAEGIFSDLAGLIQWPDTGTFMDNLLAHLQNLRNCIYLAGDSEYLTTLDATIAAIQGGADAEDLPEDFLNSTKDDFQKRANGVIDEVAEGSALGKARAFERQYQIMLEQMGVYDMLDLMDQIVTCMSNICEDAMGFGQEVEDYRDKLKIGMDDVANPDFANSEKIDALKKAKLQQANDAMTAVKDSITNVTWI